jgi:ABC-type transport system involved in cytochrome c biogenesis ATPase subunit
MKQRLGIARAIVHDPPLLVLDEPASGLDPKARLELKDLIRRLNREGKTVFITSTSSPTSKKFALPSRLSSELPRAETCAWSGMPILPFCGLCFRGLDHP